jgi:hypothetical protein
MGAWKSPRALCSTLSPARSASLHNVSLPCTSRGSCTSVMDREHLVLACASSTQFPANALGHRKLLLDYVMDDRIKVQTFFRCWVHMRLQMVDGYLARIGYTWSCLACTLGKEDLIDRILSQKASACMPRGTQRFTLAQLTEVRDFSRRQTNAQLEGAFEYFGSTGGEAVDPAALDAAAGVGVEVRCLP